MKDRFGAVSRGVRGTLFWKSPQLGRRMFFRHAGAALSGYFLWPGRPLLTEARGEAPPAKAKNCIFILLAGAPSHTDMFDFKEGAWTPASFAPETYDGVRFPRGLMPNLASQLGAVALLRSARSWALVHGLAQTWMQIARNPVSGLARIAPHIGSVASLEFTAAGQTLPGFVSLNTGSGPGSGYFAPQYAPFYVTPGGAGLNNTKNPAGQAAFERRYGFLTEMDAELRADASIGGGAGEMVSFNESARRLMYNASVDAAFTFSAEERAKYGSTAFGNACLTARNLLKGALGSRFIQITLGSWDHHSNIYAATQLPRMAKQLDDGLGALLADLKDADLLNDTLVVAMGEFGRTVGALNTQGGRDHFMQSTVVLAGAGIRGPRVIGQTDAQGAETVEPGWSQQRDIRPEDVAATIYTALGIDYTKVLRDDPLGRGFEYIPTNQGLEYFPVREVWG